MRYPVLIALLMVSAPASARTYEPEDRAMLRRLGKPNVLGELSAAAAELKAQTATLPTRASGLPTYRRARTALRAFLHAEQAAGVGRELELGDATVVRTYADPSLPLVTVYIKQDSRFYQHEFTAPVGRYQNARHTRATVTARSEEHISGPRAHGTAVSELRAIYKAGRMPRFYVEREIRRGNTPSSRLTHTFTRSGAGGLQWKGSHANIWTLHAAGSEVATSREVVPAGRRGQVRISTRAPDGRRLGRAVHVRGLQVPVSRGRAR